MIFLGMFVVATLLALMIYTNILGSTVTVSNEMLFYLVLAVAFLHELDVMIYLSDVEDLIRKIMKEKEEKKVIK